MKPDEFELGEVHRWRSEFPILESCTYLISNSLGAMPSATKDNLAAYCDLWETRGVRAWEDIWWDMPARIGEQLAGILGAKGSSVSIHPNVTTAQWVALSSLNTSARRRKIVYSELNFLWESWLKVFTNNISEAIENTEQNKRIDVFLAKNIFD